MKRALIALAFLVSVCGVVYNANAGNVAPASNQNITRSGGPILGRLRWWSLPAQVPVALDVQPGQQICLDAPNDQVCMSSNGSTGVNVCPFTATPGIDSGILNGFNPQVSCLAGNNCDLLQAVAGKYAATYDVIEDYHADVSQAHIGLQVAEFSNTDAGNSNNIYGAWIAAGTENNGCQSGNSYGSNTGSIRAIVGFATHESQGTASDLRGVQGLVGNSSGGNVLLETGIRGVAQNLGAGTVNESIGVYAPTLAESGICVGKVGVGIQEMSGGTNNVDLLIDTNNPPTVPDGNYAFYSSSALPSYLAGDLKSNGRPIPNTASVTDTVTCSNADGGALTCSLVSNAGSEIQCVQVVTPDGGDNGFQIHFGTGFGGAASNVFAGFCSPVQGGTGFAVCVGQSLTVGGPPWKDFTCGGPSGSLITGNSKENCCVFGPHP